MNKHEPALCSAPVPESFLATLCDAMPGAIAFFDGELRCRYANRAFFEWLGDRFASTNEAFLRKALAGHAVCYERAVPTLDGSERHLLVNCAPAADDTGAIAGCHLFISDVSPRKDAQAQLQIASTVFDHAADGIMVTDVDGTILAINPAFTEITGYCAADTIGKPSRMFTSDQQGAAFTESLERELAAEGRWEGEVWHQRKNGEDFLARQTIRMIRDRVDDAIRYVAILSDITERWRKSERIRHLAYHDELTGLPNRSIFMERLNDEIAAAESNARLLALMFIDLDGFKDVNDRFGHSVGDAVLQKVAQKLQSLTRRTDMVARMGGDEFVALILDTPSDKPAARIARTIIDGINDPIDVHGAVVRVGASIGIAMYPTNGRSGQDLMREADAAMYLAKTSGKNTYRLAPFGSTDESAQAYPASLNRPQSRQVRRPAN